MRKEEGVEKEREGEKLMAQGNSQHYTCFKGVISVRVLQSLKVDTRM